MNDSLLYYGDNLDVLRRHEKDESVNLVYLDPPFNLSTRFALRGIWRKKTRSICSHWLLTSTVV